MPLLAPISHHLDLNAYWLSKRGSRRMPARSDLEPAKIPPLLLPHLAIAERVGDQFRARLFGTGVVETWGFDATGYFAGEYVNNPYFYAEVRATFDTVHDRRLPVFVTGEFLKSLRTGALHAWSHVILPLSDDDRTVNKTICSFVVRLHPNLTASPDWLGCQPAKVLEVTCFADAGQLGRLCREWDRRWEPVAAERLADC
jgi:hypothetical protein